MEAIVWHGRNDVRWEEVPEPRSPKPGEVRVRVAFAGICGTDLEEYLAGPLYIPVDTPHPLTGRKAPLILGHEFSGVVEQVGPGVTDLAVGDPVAADCLIHCGQCVECQRGNFNLCEKLAALGQMADGGLSELVTGPAYSFVRLPQSVPLDQAALAEPLAVAVRAVTRAQLRPGAQVLITGAGAIGLFALQVARVQGAGAVTVVESHDHRRQLALELGADVVVSSCEALDARAAFDAVIECTGQPPVQASVIGLVRPHGRVVLVGIPTRSTVMETWGLINGERELIGSLSHLAQVDFAAGVALMGQGSIQVTPLISRRWPLRDGVRALETLARGDEDVVKIILEPGHRDDVGGTTKGVEDYRG